MKRILSIILVVAMFLGLFCYASLTSFASIPSADSLGGYENVCLTYTFRTSDYDNGRHYENDLMPYTAYYDTQGNIKDFFFDSYLFLPCMDFGPSGARMHVDTSNPTKAIDWTSYVEDTFYRGANVDALDKAFGSTKSALGDTESKAGVFFTILYPCYSSKNFGTLGGRDLDLSKVDDRKFAVQWMIDEQIRLFTERNYENLELVGFYWLEEFIVQPGDKALLLFASEYLHSKGLKFIWIPWYCSNGYNKWEQYGFDVACMQPNMYWMGNFDPYRVSDSCEISRQYGLSMEMELDSRVVEDDYYARYLNYLEGGMKSGMMNSIKMYYQDGKPAVYYQACHSANSRYRSVYDLTYKYAKGILTQEDIDNNRPEGFSVNYVDKINMNEILYSGVNWISIGKTYSGSRSYVDGNGMDYQNVDGRELTDGIIANQEVSTDWHAFHYSNCDNEGRLSVTIDLGEIREDITDFAAHFDNRQKYGIGSPSDVSVYVSQDGTNYRLLSKPQMTFDRENSCFHFECEPVKARYVKMSLSCQGASFIFCSEFLVGAKKQIIENVSEEATEASIDISQNVAGEDSDNTVLAVILVSVAVILLIIAVVIIYIKRRKQCN